MRRLRDHLLLRSSRPTGRAHGAPEDRLQPGPSSAQMPLCEGGAAETKQDDPSASGKVLDQPFPPRVGQSWMPAFAGMSGRRLRVTMRSALAMLVATSLTPALAADDLTVGVVNASEPTLCAETDNVYLKLFSPQVRSFKIEAVHPAYVGTIVVDRSAFDLRNCPELAAAPVITEKPRRITIHETPDWQLVGITIPNFWRKDPVPVRVGDRVETGVQLLQLWTRAQERAEEVLVLYPQDGYWRARPLPPVNLKWSAYGTSFLVGPIDVKERPFVDIREVVFDPETKTFTLTFARGGKAMLRLETLDQERQVLDVTLDPPIGGGDTPFAALRSMFVTETNNDVAHVGWRVKGASGWQQQGVMDFKQANAAEIWAGRLVPSRHNTSAPDVLLRDFKAR